MSLTPYKLFVLLLCPATLLLGNVLPFVLPDHFRGLQINKDGWLNSVFVKKGWLWNSLVGWWCILRYGGFQLNRQTLIRYSILTVWWYVFTQASWFGIAPIMDLIFTYTGGHCDFSVFDLNGDLAASFHDSVARRLRSLKRILLFLQNTTVTKDKGLLDRALSDISCALSEKCSNRTSCPEDINNFVKEAVLEQVPLMGSAQCRSLGGHWIGGHDPSGHVFLITLMVMSSFGELQVFGHTAFERLRRKNYKRVFAAGLKLFDNGLLWNLINKRPQGIKQFILLAFILPPVTLARDLFRFSGHLVRTVVWQNPIILFIVLLVMWWWSFLVTCIVFHTFSEQLSGLLFAYVVAGITYWNDQWFIHTAMPQ